MKLYGFGAGASFDLQNNPNARGYKPQMVPVRTLKSVCDEYIKEWQDIHFLKIDVENWENHVIEGMDFKKYRPWIVCIEATIPNTKIPMWDEWEDI